MTEMGNGERGTMGTFEAEWDCVEEELRCHFLWTASRSTFMQWWYASQGSRQMSDGISKTKNEYQARNKRRQQGHVPQQIQQSALQGEPDGLCDESECTTRPVT
mmetsp:Transcript_52201/g.111129  ORF Transcript_52201/g.111129 Transcript_52201/m.111129 type:complete len:104 (-) Transcript_52201:463-774(-)